MDWELLGGCNWEKDMNIALIVAGGKGARMSCEIPKQFIEVKGKPILAYTLERFEKFPFIDSIYIVCLAGWEEFVRKFVRGLGFQKVQGVVPGGDTALASIQNGVDALSCGDDDIVIVHDGVRPLVDEESVRAVIDDSAEYGCAVSSIPLTEHLAYVNESRLTESYLPRENAFRTVTPQAYRYSKLISAFRKSAETGIGRNSSFIGTMMMDLGEPVCLSKGSEKNIKITHPHDLVYFRAEIGDI